MKGVRRHSHQLLAGIRTLGHSGNMSPKFICAIGLLLAVSTWSGSARAAVAAPVTVVACAPGYPGSTAEARPAMDAFAAALAEASGWPRAAISAVYEETEQGGVARLSQVEAGVALVPLPFLAKHGEALKLLPGLQVEQKDRGLTEVWSLVAKKGRVGSPRALAGFDIASIAGYAPGFVRAVLSRFGSIPASAKVIQSSQVLSALRKAVAGENEAVLLDGAQTVALSSLPFANELETVARSDPLPVAFVARVGNGLSTARWKALERGFEKLGSSAESASALEAIRTVRFVPASPAAVAEVRRLVSVPVH